ncbi:MAG: ParB/RepB/Spo0J family partition protein [Eubacteriales bacterium]|jgi:ParB family chromosome partitioning protein
MISNDKPRINYISIDAICPNPDNPRKHFDPEELEKLAQSIREVGVLQPVLIVINGMSNFKGDGTYRLVAGERRWRAAAIAGLEYIPVVMKDLTLEQEAEIMLIENLQRQDLDPIEEAQAYKTLLAMRNCGNCGNLADIYLDDSICNLPDENKIDC